MLTASAAARVQTLDQRSSTEALGERFEEFLGRVKAARSPAVKKQIVDEYIGQLKRYGRAVIEDLTVNFVYHGSARRVGVPSDLNGWDAAADTMSRVPGTSLFYLPKRVDRAARFEYKIAVDSSWILDPFNQLQAVGGYGPNSEIWMPRYSPPQEIGYRPDIPHGTIDTLYFKSRLLGRTHPIFIYRPPRYDSLAQPLPSLYVTDGGEYLTLALMSIVLDNLIADKRISPVVGIFIDPRTDIRDAKTSMRMHDYTMSDTFVSFLTTELLPKIKEDHRLDERPGQTGIMGASLGGLIATYASFRRPDVFGLCAAQSPAYWWKDEVMIKTMAGSSRRPVKFYIDTGTIRDAQVHARKMKQLLEEKGYELKYGEYPEAHNWSNWRARVDDILECFWGIR